jgi:hypothetical protein
MPVFDEEIFNIWIVLQPFAALFFVGVVGLWIKDIIQSFAKGIKFKMNGAFHEGQKVILDGQEALIVKIGITETVFGVYTERGYTWRFVPNERIPFLKLEKIIDAGVHRDSKEERAQKFYDSLQDTKIAANKESIDRLNNKVD